MTLVIHSWPDCSMWISVALHILHFNVTLDLFNSTGCSAKDSFYSILQARYKREFRFDRWHEENHRFLSNTVVFKSHVRGALWWNLLNIYVFGLLIFVSLKYFTFSRCKAKNERHSVGKNFNTYMLADNHTLKSLSVFNCFFIKNVNFDWIQIRSFGELLWQRKRFFDTFLINLDFRHIRHL